MTAPAMMCSSIVSLSELCRDLWETTCTDSSWLPALPVSAPCNTLPRWYCVTYQSVSAWHLQSYTSMKTLDTLHNNSFLPLEPSTPFSRVWLPVLPQSCCLQQGCCLQQSCCLRVRYFSVCFKLGSELSSSVDKACSTSARCGFLCQS